MPRLLLVALLLAATAAPATAQARFGLRAGLNAVTWTGSDLFDFGTRLRFVGGGFVRLPISSAFAVQPEILYSQKGAELPLSGLSYSIDYIEVPVLARVAVPLSPRLETGVLLGPTVGVPVRDDIDAGDIDVTESLDTRTDVGLALGADVGAGPFAVDLRYTFGLINPLSDPEPPATQGFEVRNGAFSATFAYLFGR